MDDYFSLILKLSVTHLVLLTFITSLSFYLLKQSNGKTGMTPESPQTNVCIIVMTVLSLIAVSLDENYTLQFGLVNSVLLVHTCWYLMKHISHYFVFKAKIRAARIVYQQSGEKSDLSVPGYTSLNTLMLTVLVHIFGVFVYSAACYYAFIGFNDIDSMSYDDYEL